MTYKQKESNSFIKPEQWCTICGCPLSLAHDSIDGCSVVWGIFDLDPLTHLLDFSHHSWRIAEKTRTHYLNTLTSAAWGL